ncbi:MAG: hypothetical protein HC896_00090 [Bacteroidales bacterium]|nr:hypothetical protein [Bacteroidales bacterium]
MDAQAAPWLFKNDEPLPLGTWSNLRRGDNNTMLADSNFDANDDFAKSISSKVEQDIIRMSSIGIEVIETSTAPELMLPGQTLPTVTKCKLMEVSIVDMGGNDNALVLYNSGGDVINLSKGNMPDFFKLEHTNENANQNFKSMKLIALFLGLAETATETEVLDNIKKLKEDNVKLSANFDTLNNQVKLQKEANVTAMVNEAIKLGKFTADKKEQFTKMANLDFDTAKAIIDSMPGAKKPTSLINDGGAGKGAVLSWDEVAKGGITALEKWKAEDKEAYVLAYEEKYKVKYINPKE